MRTPSDPRASSGVLYAASAYLAWGVFPIYWKQLAAIPPAQILAHRVLWSFVFVGGLLRFTTGFGAVRTAAASATARRALAASTALISLNWFLFIWAVNTGRILEASLGYYINPLLNVLAGRLVFGERLSRAQLVAVGLAAIGVGYLAIAQGRLPWVSVVLAATFASYGVVRKRAPVDSATGLFVETALVTPLAVAFLAGLVVTAPGELPREPWTIALCLGAGVVTALPLLWFAEGARRIRYSTLGILQYIAPTSQLLCGVLLYGERFTRAHAITFALIWSAVVVYAWDGLRRARR
ncbi:EamA family transporter RarD [Myxococcota bacterium]|nr:EamA family transporter RarD [Myxococcota bacterium]